MRVHTYVYKSHALKLKRLVCKRTTRVERVRDSLEAVIFSTQLLTMFQRRWNRCRRALLHRQHSGQHIANATSSTLFVRFFRRGNRILGRQIFTKCTQPKIYSNWIRKQHIRAHELYLSMTISLTREERTKKRSEVWLHAHAA